MRTATTTTTTGDAGRREEETVTRRSEAIKAGSTEEEEEEEEEEEGVVPPVPLVSVLLPINNAMPYLPVAVRDVVKQDLGGDARLELICSWDGGAKSDWAWLVALVEALGADRATLEEVRPPERQTPSDAARDRIRTGGEPPTFVASGVPAWAPAANPAKENAPNKDAAKRNAFFFSGNQEEVDEAKPTTKEEKDADDKEEEDDPSLSARRVAGHCRAEHRVKVVRYADRANRGQGAAMSLALARSDRRAEYVAQMEADDARPSSDAFRCMLEALRERPDWHGVCTEAFCFGENVSPRMRNYVEWQNSLEDPAALCAERFVEIPALHQTALFRRSVVDAVLEPTDGCYRDGPVGDASAGDSSSSEVSFGAALDTPVDLWWWLAFFDAGFRCGRVVGCRRLGADVALSSDQPPPTAFFGWRQHATQRTRAHGRLSIENLRRIKIHWIDAHASRLFRPRDDDDDDDDDDDESQALVVLIISVGATLDAWAADLEAHPGFATRRIVKVQWRPSKRAPPPSPYVPRDALRATYETTQKADTHGQSTNSMTPPRTTRVLRLWAYGDARVRRRIKPHLDDWRDDWDFFVA